MTLRAGVVDLALAGPRGSGHALLYLCFFLAAGAAPDRGLARQTPAAAIPLPPPRPADLGLPRATGSPAPSKPPVPAAPSGLDGALGDVAEFSRLETNPGSGECFVEDPVSLVAVKLKSGRRVPLRPPAVLAAAFASRFAAWARDDLVEAAGPRGDLAEIDDAGSYECRGQNRVAGAKLSEHAKGDAIDIAAIRFADGRRYEFKRGAGSDMGAAIKRTACAAFSTVLGPGSDSSHETHLHLDARARRGGAGICQWEADNAPVPPRPRAQPMPAAGVYAASAKR